MRTKANSRKRGFSLVEVLISTAILGIGLSGLVELHVSSIRGLQKTQRLVAAQEIATQQVELLLGRSAEAAALPSCPLSSREEGCKATLREMSAEKTCTSYVQTADVPNPDGEYETVPESSAAYRVDTGIEPHPDRNAHRDAFVATVSVCWLDEHFDVHQVMVTRLLVPES